MERKTEREKKDGKIDRYMQIYRKKERETEEREREKERERIKKNERFL